MIASYFDGLFFFPYWLFYLYIFITRVLRVAFFDNPGYVFVASRKNRSIISSTSNLIKISITVWLTENTLLSIFCRGTSIKYISVMIVSSDGHLKVVLLIADGESISYASMRLQFVIRVCHWPLQLLLLVYQLSSIRKLSPIRSSLPTKREDKESNGEKYSENPLIRCSNV